MSDPLDPTTINQRLRDNRARVLAGEDVAPEEYREIIAALRASRIAATQAELRRPRRKSPVIPISASTLEDL